MIKTEQLKVSSENIIGSNDPSAIVEFESTNKGMLIPRMTSAQRDAISSPATSLLIFNTDTNRYNFFNGLVWVSFSKVSSEYRHDFDEPYDYIAYAPKGSTDGDNIWVITRITIATNGNTISERAVLVDWTNRTTHIYT